MSFKRLLLYFVIWRIFLLFSSFLGGYLFPLQIGFLGGGITNYLESPLFWSGLNFDGEHFFAIAKIGYQPLTYFYFPLYPLLTSLLGHLLGGSDLNIAIAGLFISHSTFLVGLFGLIKLMKLDFSDKIINYTIILILIFPTSFYFSSYYSESLYFCLTIWSFYFFRKSKFLLSAITGFGVALTRLVGATLVFANLGKIWKTKKINANLVKSIISASTPIAGLIFYMYFLYIRTGDPLNFYNSISIFGDQRSSNLITIPQVLYRYFFKIIPNINYDYFPAVFFSYLELLAAILFMGIIIYGIWKLDVSYTIYSALSFIIPSLSGSFSSFPRYALTIFPAFIILALLFSNKPKLIKSIWFGTSLMLLSIATALFSRGYWIS